MPSDGRVELEDVFAQRNTIVDYYQSLLGEMPPVGFTYASRQVTPLAVFCDEAEDVNNQVSGAPYYWYNGATTASFNPLYSSTATVTNSGDIIIYNTNAWLYYFALIRRCNTFLQQIPSNTAIDIKDVEVEGMIAEVKVLRAFAYLQLMKRYGRVPLTDTPYDAAHDYAKDTRASIAQITDFIITQCDEALATPENEAQDMAFLWTPRSNTQRTKIPRAFAWAVKSQTALYAASPLFYEDGSKYDWSKAAEITKAALDQCLEHGYTLYNRAMNDDMNAKTLNTYGYYFIQRADPTRALDKETIFESKLQASIWTYAALPIVQGGLTAGPCPSQELVDAYEMQETGLPISDPASGYDETNPYNGRDPRFYASIYYNGALFKWVKGASQYLTPRFYDNRLNGGMTVTLKSDTTTITTTGDTSYIETGYLGGTIDYDEAYLIFEYTSNQAVDGAYFYVATGTSAIPTSPYKSAPITLSKADAWTTYRYDLRDFMDKYEFGKLSSHRLGLKLNGTGLNMEIRGLKIEMATPPRPLTSVETYVGGNCGISDNTSEIRRTRTGYYLRKFNSAVSETGNNDDGYFKIFRLAELYLNFAEAAYNASTPEQKYGDLSATDAVNAVRARADMPPLPAGLSKDAFEERYRNERRVELAFEEHRFFDVRRWKILSETDRGVHGMRITMKNPPADSTFVYEPVPMVTRQTYADKYLLYPIPQTEVNKMLQYTGTSWQNPGWN
ncbi:MAG: RagB/SusD family nutrient uptake outer membrane protein [Prevotellaceae bacterium]|nr:RagB/SusD family nutrient uptake outer membrane protein [Prevotellaceae bacterium]